MQGTDLDGPPPARATTHEITAAGGITALRNFKALLAMNIHTPSAWRSTQAD